MEVQKPAHTIRFGRIKATIWANQSPNGVWYNVQVSRSYRDGDEWKQSDSFGRDDLLLLCKALGEAHTWIYQHGRREALGSAGYRRANQVKHDAAAFYRNEAGTQVLILNR